jgi:gamma-polyglutamate biosynthesis protein CapA
MKTAFVKIILGFFLFAVIVLTLVFLTSKRGSFAPGEEYLSMNGDDDLGSKNDNRPLRLLFGGDLMFDRHIRLNAQEYDGYDFIFSDLKELFFDYDLVIANLEGPITDNSSVSLGTIPGSPENFIFTFDPKVAQALADHNIRIVCLGNNHILNFGQEGLDSTKRYLEQNGVAFFGFTGDDKERTLVKEVDGFRLGFVNYNQFLSGGLAAVKEDIDDLLPYVDWLILYAHWGNEYQAYPQEEIKTLAHQFIDQGVDLVIGSHPHVVLPSEEYQGKTIYYSLGNFVFDQYFSLETMTGILIEVVINIEEKEITTREWPIKMEKSGRTTLSPS